MVMDVASSHIINFVNTLNEQYERFLALGDVFSQLGYDCDLSLNIGGNLFTIIESASKREFLAIAFFDLQVKARNDEESHLNIYLLWDEPFWVIRTEIWVEAGTGGMSRLQPFPERQAKTFEECRIQLDDSIDDLFARRHLLIEWLKSKEPTTKQPAVSNRGSLRSSRLLPSGVKLSREKL
jgi:hypothetical protein